MKTNPREHQKNILNVFDTTDNFAFLWEMGLGKTWLGCYSIEKFFDPTKKYLIICPKSVTDVWYNELLKHTDIEEHHIGFLLGIKEKRIKILKSKPILILNYQGLLVLKDELKNYNYEIIIADESHRIKNHKAMQTKVALSLTSKKRYIMSGTPIAKDYLDAFSQWLFLDRGRTLGTSFYGFRAKYFFDANSGRYRGTFADWKIKENSEKQINILLSRNSHRLEKIDVIDLPEKIHTIKYCELSSEQKKAYKDLESECITFINDNAITAQVALTRLIRLTQITSGFYKTADGKEINFPSNPKLELCEELVEEILDHPTNKIIIWSHYVKDIENLMKKFEKYKPAVIYGAIKNRNEQVQRFQNDPNCRIFIAQFQSACEGITLTSANYSIRYSYDFNYITWIQAEDRCHRQGSEKHKSITYLNLVMKNTLDEKILQVLDQKNMNSKEILDFIKNKIDNNVLI